MTPKKPPLPPSDKPRRGRPRGSADLTKLSGVQSEMARLYREMRAGKTERGEARVGVWILSQITNTIAVTLFEKRLAELEAAYSADDSKFETFDVRQLPVRQMHS